MGGFSRAGYREEVEGGRRRRHRDNGNGSFGEWLRQVDGVLRQAVGLTHRDLADQTWRDWHASGMSPREAAFEALENEQADGMPGLD